MKKRCLILFQQQIDSITEIEISDYLESKYDLDVKILSHYNQFQAIVRKEGEASKYSLVIYANKMLHPLIAKHFSHTFVLWINDEDVTNKYNSNNIRYLQRISESELSTFFIDVDNQPSEFKELFQAVPISTKTQSNERSEKDFKEELLDGHTSVIENPKLDTENPKDVTKVQQKILKPIDRITELKPESSVTKKEIDNKNQLLYANSKATQPKKVVLTKGIDYVEDPFFARGRNIQKQAFSRQLRDEHRTIGIWSPIHRMGVTTFTLNFALYLAENRIYTSVLEGLTEQHGMKDWLKRYTSVPPNWKSYAKSIQTDTSPEHIQWIYKNTYFLPLDNDDTQLNWNSNAIESYMTNIKIFDIALVDIPTGKMEAYTELSLNYLNELWIVVDDTFQQLVSWKQYIKELEKKYKIPFYLIFNKNFEFSQPIRIADKLDISLLATLPPLYEDVMRNYYESKALWENEEVKESLKTPFHLLSKHITGKDIEHLGIPPLEKANIVRKFLKILNI